MYRPTILVFIIYLSNVSSTISNQQIIDYPLIYSGFNSNKLLFYANNSQSKFKDSEQENLRKKEKDIEKNYANFQFHEKSKHFENIESESKENKDYGFNQRAQRRVKFQKNSHSLNRTADQQHQWLPEQTIWRPYYLPRRLNAPFGHRIMPFENNLAGQRSFQSILSRMPPPYEIFPPTQSIDTQQPPLFLNSKLSFNNQQQNSPLTRPQNPFDSVLVGNNGVFNVEFVNDRFFGQSYTPQSNFRNVDVIDNNQAINPLINNNEIEKEQPSLIEKVNDKLRFDNSSEIQLINTLNSSNKNFDTKQNTRLIKPDSDDHLNNEMIFNREIAQSFNFKTSEMKKNQDQHKFDFVDPKLFINQIKQTIITNESFSLHNATNSKPRLEEKSNLITNLNESTKILDTSPQQYSPVHFRQKFEQIQAQQRENQFINQFTPLINTSYQQAFKENLVPRINSSMEFFKPVNLLDSREENANQQLKGPQLINQHLMNTQLNNKQQQQIALTSISPSPINNYSTSNLIKRLKQQQFQNALLARLANPNGNSIEALKRINTIPQEKTTVERSNQALLNDLSNNSSGVNSTLSMHASKSKEFFARRSNTHRYMIVSVLMIAIIVISIGIILIYIKQKHFDLQNAQNSNTNPEIASPFDIRRFYQTSVSSSNRPEIR